MQAVYRELRLVEKVAVCTYGAASTSPCLVPESTAALSCAANLLSRAGLLAFEESNNSVEDLTQPGMAWHNMA